MDVLPSIRAIELKEKFTALAWAEEDVQLALTQITSRAFYPFSENRTTKWIKENSAICEITGYPIEKITKDKLYGSALKLYGIKDSLEKHLSTKTNELFDLQDKIYLYDLTNTYFEGRKTKIKLANFGRSKEKRSDCKLVALALVVNVDGFNLGKTRVYQQNNTTWIKNGEDIDLEVFPRSVSLSENGNILAVGLALHKAKIFEFDSDTWSQLGDDIEAEGSGDSTGASVSLSHDGSKVAVGSPLFNQSGNSKGLVRVFDFNTEPEPTEAFLLVEILGEGSISPNYDSETSFELGEEITVEAIPAEGYVFDKFVIDGEEFTLNPITLEMNSTKSMVVVFEEDDSFSSKDVQLEDISIYPNPFTSSVYLTTVNQPLSFEIFSSEGLLIQMGEVKNQKIQLEHLKSGLYILVLKSENHYKRIKLIKQ